MQLKISSITSLTDARYFSAIGADYLGFCLDALNENAITIEKAREITSWLHEPVIVGEFGLHQSKEEIEFIAQQMEISEIQIPFLHEQKKDLSFRKFLYVEDWQALGLAGYSDYLVIRLKEKDIHDPELKNILNSSQVFIETDLHQENIREIVETLKPFGLQITCKREERSGMSAVDEYAELLEKIGIS